VAIFRLNALFKNISDKNTCKPLHGSNNAGIFVLSNNNNEHSFIQKFIDMNNATTTTTTTISKSTFACTLAAQIMAADKTMTRSDAMTTAWLIVRKSEQKETIVMLTFAKISGETCRRVVSTNWKHYAPPTGTGKPAPAGLKLYADLGKYIGGQRCIISTYNVLNVVALAA
jgi:hypothetical protein